MHFSMKISYLFSSVYGRARGGGSSAYCGTGSSAWWSHRIYLSCYIIDFSCDESQVLTDPVNNKQALAPKSDWKISTLVSAIWNIAVKHFLTPN